jgi:hypothetical protein
MPFSLSRLQSYLFLLFAVLALGTIAIMLVEGLSAFDAFYFVVVTIATVGYGDISPSGIYGRAVTILIIIAGVGTFVAVFADIVENLLSRDERRSRQKKINMIVGLFFSEFGTDLLSILSARDPSISEIRKEFLVSESWSASDFRQLKIRLGSRGYGIAAESMDLVRMKQVLSEKKGFLSSLLENPVIFEHDSFTETLQAFFHLTEELMYRKNPSDLPPGDIEHLLHDLNRGYRLLVIEWITYMQHLKEHYPYLFSLAMRTNPFNPEAEAIIGGQTSVS